MPKIDIFSVPYLSDLTENWDLTRSFLIGRQVTYMVSSQFSRQFAVGLGVLVQAYNYFRTKILIVIILNVKKQSSMHKIVGPFETMELNFILIII